MIDILSNTKNVYFYWDGEISEQRLTILKNSVYSTRAFNPDRPIYLVTNTLNQQEFDGAFDIQVVPWTWEWLNVLPDSVVSSYHTVGPRQFSDLFRLVLLYRWGGSYIDTDDICINQMSNVPNIVCRSYDPHTSYYNGLEMKDCIPGIYREVRGYDHINFFPRNDCFQNWSPEHFFFSEGIFKSPEFLNTPHPLDIIGSKVSFQSIINNTCIRFREHINHVGGFNTHLTLLYLYEDWLAKCSLYDLGDIGGEMHDYYNQFKEIHTSEWGTLKVSMDEALDFTLKVFPKYPSLSHLWLHSKDQEPEWQLKELDFSRKYYLSTWLYYWSRGLIEGYRCLVS